MAVGAEMIRIEVEGKGNVDAAAAAAPAPASSPARTDGFRAWWQSLRLSRPRPTSP